MTQRTLIAIALFLSLGTSVRAEEITPSFKIAGSVGAAFREKDFAFNFGGPKLQASHGDYSASAGFFPSLLYLNGQTPSFRPSLGFGFELNYKRLGIIVPFYYARNQTLPYFGISFKL